MIMMLSARVYVRLSGRMVRTWSVRNARVSATRQESRQIFTAVFHCQDKKNSIYPQISTVIESEGKDKLLNYNLVGKSKTEQVISDGEVGHGIQVYPEILDHLPSKCTCTGCGSVFQSIDANKPGYIIASKNPALNKEKDQIDVMKPVICERCFNIQNYNKGTPAVVSSEQITDYLGHIAHRKALILYVIDILDLPGSLVPGLLDIVGEAKRIIVVSNKLDMIPLDGKPACQVEKLTSAVLEQICKENGLKDANIKGVCLTSAKTGFGIPQLINKVLKHWDGKGDIYLVGSNNTGKTSLFNMLLDLTNVHKKGGNMLQRCTVSRMPGTTLSLLRFGFGHWKLTKLKHRLHDGINKENQEFQDSDDYDIDPKIIDVQETAYKRLTSSSSKAVLPVETQASPDDVALEVFTPEVINRTVKEENQAWFYDTPGIINENQITNYLSMEELKLLSSNLWIVPRTFILKPGQAFLLGGLARVDFVQISRESLHQETEDDTLTEANKSIYFTVFTSPNLPVHVLSISRAQEMYEKHVGQKLLMVPYGGPNRMQSFPALEPHDFTVKGIGWKESAADIVLSNIGWVSVTAGYQADVLVRAYTPNARGLVMRQPALLSTCVNQRGKRGVSYLGHRNSAGYESQRKKSPQLVKFLSYGHHGVYQWMREAKRKKKQQTALIKEAKMKKIMDKSLAAGSPEALLGDREKQQTKKELT